MDLQTGSLTAVFSVWWGISACNQLYSGALTSRLRRHIPLGLIPLWTFFAPNPARSDSRLVWRDECDGRWSGWKEVHFGFAPCSRRWLLNPELILNKAIADLVNSLARSGPELDERSKLLTSSYISLLHITASRARPKECTGFQFAILRTSNTSASSRRLEITFLSEVHDVSDNSCRVH